VLILTLCLTVPSLLTVGLYGNLSDKYGRVKIMLIPTVGLLLNRLCAIAAILFGVSQPAWLTIGQLLQGLFGGMPSLFMSSFAYTADCADSTRRSASFGILEAFLFMGFVVGPFVGGALSQEGRVWVFVCSAALNLLMLVIIACAPESLQKENRVEKFELKKANVFSTMGILLCSKTVMLLALGFALVVLCYNAFILVFVLYADKVFGWKEYEDGIFLTIQWSSRAIGVGILLPLLLKIKSFWVEGWVIRLGTLSYVGAFIIYGLAQVPWVFVSATFLDGIGSMSLPVFRSLLSRSVSQSEQGRILSATGALEGLAEILAPAIFNFSLTFLINVNPAIVFYMMSGLVLISFLCSVLIRAPENSDLLKPLLEPSDRASYGSEESDESTRSIIN